MYLPVRHGEGKIVPMDQNLLNELEKKQLIAMQYVSPETDTPTQEYPYNPNGSPLGAAGLTDPSGRIFGLMPHPEAFNHPTNHPGWTRGETAPLGALIFENGVKYLSGQ